MELKARTNKRQPLSKRKQWIVIIIMFIGIIYLMNNDSDIPDGFSKGFYKGAVDTFYATENILWNNQKPLNEDQQNWIMEYIYDAEIQDYSVKEMKAVAAYENYQYVAIIQPTDRDPSEDPEWYPAYQYARIELLKALELE